MTEHVIRAKHGKDQFVVVILGESPEQIEKATARLARILVQSKISCTHMVHGSDPGKDYLVVSLEDLIRA